MSEPGIEDRVTVEYRLSRPDLRGAARAWRKRQRLRQIVVLAAPIVWGFLTSGFTGDAQYFVAGLTVSIGLFAALRVLQSRLLRTSAGRLGDIKVTITNDGVRKSNDLGTADSNWSAYGGYVETDEVFVLYDNPTWAPRLLILPKRAFAGSEDIERIRRTLSQNLRRHGRQQPSKDGYPSSGATAAPG